jgi:spore germination protein GerM
MNRRTASLLLAVVLLIAVGILGLWCSQRDRTARPTESVEAESPLPEAEMVPVELYFPGAGGWLFVERGTMPAADGTEQRLRILLERFLEGPEDEGLYPAFPPEVGLGDAIVTADGVAYVDLAIAGESSNLPWGSKQEMLAVYGLVDTVLLNLPEIRGVVLLRNGEQRSTFAGHLDTTRLLVANRDLVADRGP